VAVDSSGRWLAVHLGDGGIVGRFGTDVAEVCRPQKGEFVNQTFFVTDSDAAANLRVVGWGRDDETRTASGFALFTDGMEGSLVHRRTGQVASAIPQMLSWFDGNTDAEIAAALDRNIAEVFLPRTSDDCTLVVVVAERETSRESAASTDAAIQTSDPESPPPPRRRKEQRRRKGHKNQKRRGVGKRHGGRKGKKGRRSRKKR
jgi:hypothetical protein